MRNGEYKDWNGKADTLNSNNKLLSCLKLLREYYGIALAE